MKILDKVKEGLSRRGFLGAMAAVGATASLYGCSKDGGTEYIYSGSGSSTSNGLADDIYFTEDPVYRYGSSGHNCGGRCIIKAQVTGDGRIVRFLTDETKYAYDGTSIDNSNRNSTQARACARCRAYKGRLYHPGRLKYPLKQTKERGDMSGFVRIPWSQAYEEIADRLKAVQGEYGPESFHAIYACGNYSGMYQGGSYNGLYTSVESVHATIRLLGGGTPYTSDYSFHQNMYMGGYALAYSYSGLINVPPSTNDVAGVGKHIIMWGANTPSTHNAKAYPMVKGFEDMKKRDPEATVTFIGPEFSECGISSADEWIQIRPYTDTALILGMFHEMIINTVNANGTIATTPWLDLNYIDTMVYGFFDSPGYWLDTSTGEFDITTAAPATADPKVVGTKSWISPVPDGQSLSAYIMGTDDRLTKLAYGSGCYVADQYTKKVAGIKRNGATCSYNVKAADQTKYAYKKDMKVTKDADWASTITGVPAERIRALAKQYIDAAKNGQPLWNEWAGGQLKQAEGCSTIFSLHALAIVTKNWGITGTGVGNNAISRSITVDPDAIASTAFRPAAWTNTAIIPAMPKQPAPSVTQWHNAIKFAFGDKLKTNGYTPNILDWNNGYAGSSNGLGNGHAYYNDGGTKALVKRNLKPGDPAPTTFDVVGADGITRSYYTFEGANTSNPTASTPVFSGFRFIMNSGGNIPVNQHANSIDSSEMFKHLPTYEYADAKYNVEKKDAFYMVCFDNFMAPSARYSDYVLPAKTMWEQEDFISIEANTVAGAGGTMYVDSVIAGPGESKSTWDFTRDLIAAYGGSSAAATFTGDTAGTTFKNIVQKKYNTDIKTNPASPFYGKSWDEYLKKPISHASPSIDITTSITKNAKRDALDKYLNGESGDIVTTYFKSDISSTDANLVYGFGNNEFAETITSPNQSKRFNVYSGPLKWRYENLFSKWHGYLAVDQQGQYKADDEGDPVVYPIPMFYDYRDYFREAYGLSSNDQLAGRFLLTTTHDRFRAHSSQSENPYLRELTHRVEGGALYSGNDSGYYAISSDPNGNMDEFPPLNSKIGTDGLPTDKTIASYTDIWVNDIDFADMADGTLVEVYNEIGSVYCTIRKTKRCVKGYVGLHQGCWFDPRTIGGKTVDVGGNCNTLMSSKPSRIDHGNAQQSAMVNIRKVR